MKKLITSILMTLTMVSTVYAADTITVTFDPNGGTVATNLLTTESGKSLPDENTPTRTGSDFLGWTYDPDADYVIRLTEIKPTSDVTLYAKWMTNKSDSYVVTLDANGGSYQYSPRAYVYNRTGTTMDEPTTPTRDGWSFQGWSTSSTSSQLVDVNTTSSETTYYAVWSQGGGGSSSTEQVTVTFDSAGGSSIAPVTVDKGSTVTKPEDPTYTGKHFLGWFLEGEEFDFNIGVRQDITLVAHWETVSSKNFNVTFIAGDENGGSTFADGAYMHTVNLSSVPDVLNQETPKPTRHSTFSHWSLRKTTNWGTSGAEILNPAYEVTADITLYACYDTADNGSTIAEVKFDANGGHWTDDSDTNYDVKKVNVDLNTKVVKPDNPKWGSKKFAGWYSTDDDEPEEDEKWNFNDTVVEDITLYAHWTTDDSEAETSTIEETPQEEVPQNFPNPEQLPVVEPLADGGTDAGAQSVKDIPTTGIEFNVAPLVVVVTALVAVIIFLIIKRGKKQ